MAETRIQVVGSSASSQEPVYPASQAFNDITAPQSYWQTQAWDLTNHWVAGHLSSAQVVNRIRYYASALISKNIKHAKFEGSNDGGASWTKIPASGWAQGASQYNGDEILFAITEGWQEVTLYNFTAYSRYRLFCYDTYGPDQGPCRTDYQPPGTEYYYIKYVTDLCTLPQFNRTWAIDHGYADKFSVGDIFEIIDSFAGCNDGFYTVVSVHNHDPSMDPWNGGWLAWCTVIEVAELIPDNLQKTMPTRIKKATLPYTCDVGGVPGWWGQLHMAVAELEFYEWDGKPYTPMIAHWKMNDNEANKVVIDSTESNNGIAQQNTNILHIPGKINGALNFNGVNDYIETPLSHFTGSDEITFSAWIKTTVPFLRGIVMCGETSDYGTQGILFYAGTGFASDVASAIFGTGSKGTSVIAGTTNICDGNWHHVVATHTSSKNKIYVDGIQENETGASTLSGSAWGTFGIGVFPTHPNRGGDHWFFNGKIDDVRIYNRVLTFNEIAAIYNGGIGTEGSVPYVIKHDFKCYSEGETKMQKSFSLRFEAKKDTSLEAALAREIDPVLNLTDKTQIRIYARATRTGSNFSIEFRNSNDYIITHTPNIKETYKWQSEAIDISKIANADKNSLNQIKIKIINADEDNIFWLDNILFK